MKQIFLVLILFITVFSPITAADNYEVGDELYVWARSGLNLREGPSTNDKVIATLPFGEKVHIQAKTDKVYNVKMISKTHSYDPKKKVDPLILKGNWVKVYTNEGFLGYVIDQYLLDIEYYPKKDKNQYGPSLEIISIDTTYNGSDFTIKTSYPRGIEASNGTEGESLGVGEFIFPNFTFEEAIIMIGSFENLDTWTIGRNWKGEIIIFNDSETCTTQIFKKENQVILYTECSC